jgi:large subunit ribosomal protein L31
MKADIHPKNHTISVTCACGASFETLSTTEKISTEVCSQCHPFYTGEQKFVDTAQRMKKFEDKQKKHAQMKEQRQHKNKKDKQAARRAKKQNKNTSAKNDAKSALKDALADL